MYELSLFTGGGGGVLGTHLLGWTPVGYVEIDDYAQRIIRARIDDGMLPNAPIFADVRAFIRDGYAASYKGLVDVITAGFPCQPFSIAGKQLGADDPRNMWPATIDAIRVVRPRYCLLENVPGLLASRYFGTVLGDLAESGYDARWRFLSAAEVGAPHKRDRLWIVAESQSARPLRHRDERAEPCEVRHGHDAHAGRPSIDVADAEGIAQWPRLCQDEPGRERRGRSGDGSSPHDVPDPERQRLAFGERSPGERPHPAIGRGDWWATEPGLGRVAHGVADRVDRLRALGNGQVPAVVRAAWLLLTEDIAQ